jgi:hypothetical protein
MSILATTPSCDAFIKVMQYIPCKVRMTISVPNEMFAHIDAAARATDRSASARGPGRLTRSAIRRLWSVDPQWPSRYIVARWDQHPPDSAAGRCAAGARLPNMLRLRQRTDVSVGVAESFGRSNSRREADRRGRAHCNAGWAEKAGGGGLDGRSGGMITTRGGLVSAAAEQDHDTIAPATSIRTRTQKTGDMWCLT